MRDTRTPTTMFLASLALILTFMINPQHTAHAGNDCAFDIDGMTMTLIGDCTTDSTIYVPDGMTLDGANHTITAVDPDGGHYTGAIIANGGNTAHVSRLTVTASGLANICDGGDNRLRGILFEGASGSISHSNVIGINQGASGCQEGNAIEVRNAPFDGTHPNTQLVEITHNTVTDYQKTGIVANGDVDVTITNNTISASATQENLAPNSVQLAYGATGIVDTNMIDGNQWLGASNYAATAVLIYLTDGVEINNNNIFGNSDIAVYYYGDNGLVQNNRVFDIGPDGGPNDGYIYDYGIGNWGTNNLVVNNKIRGFTIPLDGVNPEVRNVLIPSHH